MAGSSREPFRAEIWGELRVGMRIHERLLSMSFGLSLLLLKKLPRFTRNRFSRFVAIRGDLQDARSIRWQRCDRGGNSGPVHCAFTRPQVLVLHLHRVLEGTGGIRQLI